MPCSSRRIGELNGSSSNHLSYTAYKISASPQALHERETGSTHADYVAAKVFTSAREEPGASLKEIKGFPLRVVMCMRSTEMMYTFTR